MTANDKAALRNWMLAFAATAAAVVVCFKWIDRPVAEFAETHIRHTAAWGWIVHGLAPLDAVVAMLGLFACMCGAWSIFSRPLPPWTQTPLLCALAALGATVVCLLLKHLFGRSSVDPAYLQGHLYGFSLLHGGLYGQSFPSGTAAISTAIVSVLWMVAPRLRMAGGLIVLLLSAAVVITNFHWVGDVVAGIYLGALIGRAVVRLASAGTRGKTALGP
jgi:membrane-associated phospholipid phosphatase